MDGNEEPNDNPQGFGQNFYALEAPTEDEELDTFPESNSKLIVNQSERKSFLKFLTFGGVLGNSHRSYRNAPTCHCPK